MERDEVRDVMTHFVREKFEIEEEDGDFGTDVHLFDYGYVDSHGAMVMIGFVEERFGVKITNKDLMMHPMNTIDEIADFVVQKGGH